MNLTGGLVSDLSIYDRRDYRRFLSAHIQFLEGLCQLSMQLTNDSINQFLTSLFITSQLLSENNFKTYLNSLIEQSESVAPVTFARLLFLIRNINHGNAIVSTYGTNFQYFSSWYDNGDFYPYVPSQAVIYDNGCSCGLYANCTIQANFIKTNSSETIPIKGLKMGCTPSESFLASTLECFYDQLCIDLIQQYTSINSFVPLSTTMSRFAMNTTISELSSHLFVEEWTTAINYSSYFQQCLPLLCSYTYIQQFSLLYTITVLLGLQGGLTIILKWICPKLVRLITKFGQYRKKQLNVIQPTISLEISSVETNNMNVETSITNLESLSTSVPSKYILFIFTCPLT